MSLSMDPAFSLLKDHFVVGWKNIRGEDYVGSSHGYETNQKAVGTTNGAGPRNMQTFILAPDSTVLHCLPGFWHPKDLAHELHMARALYRLHKTKQSKKAKDKMFSRIQLSTLRNLPRDMVQRSGWQGFDALNEKNRLKMGKKRDTFYYDENGKPGRIKPLTTVMHERMAARPFVKFKRFDTDTFIDYGRPYYDNNKKVDGTGVRFGSKGYMASQKRMKERAMKRAEKKRKVDEYYGKKPKEKKGYDKSKWPKKESKKASETKARGSYKKKQKKSKRRPTSRPTSRPMRRKA